MKRILVLGAGADASGGSGGVATEALLALKAAGVEVVLLDSNPTTLATDPDVAHRTYLEPVTLEAASRILELERPDAVLAMLGGELALALAKQLTEEGVLAKFGARLVGVTTAGLQCVERLNARVDADALLGWRQAELLVLRDTTGTAEVVATVEFLEPVGIHPSDSVAVTPAQTFNGQALQEMIALALGVVREAALEGICAVRVAVHPTQSQVKLLQLWPALPAHTALVTRGGGRRLATEAAGLLLGKRLVLAGALTTGISLRAPRFDSERFGAQSALGPHSQSTGEVMAVAARVGEGMLKAMHALEAQLSLTAEHAPQTADRWQRVLGGAVGAPYAPWFLAEMKAVTDQARGLRKFERVDEVTDAALWMAKAQGFSDLQLAELWSCKETEVRSLRHARKVRPSLRAHAQVWTLVYDGRSCELPNRPTVLLLGGGPRRIGQGGEVEWSCAHAARALRASGKQVLLLDCTPAVSSEDFDRVCLGALAREEVLELCALLQPTGVLAQFGGRATLDLVAAGVPVLGTPPDGLDCALDRQRFARLVEALGLAQPPRRLAHTLEEARQAGRELGYPLLARTARGASLIHTEAEAIPGELESFLAEATEADVELLRDCSGTVVVAAVLEHVEQAGIHSGDAAFTLPPHSLSAEVIERLKDAATALAGALHVVGLLNVRFAVQGKAVRVLEANPRVSRTIPFVAKATGMPLVELATRLAQGETLEALGSTKEPMVRHMAVKEAVFPFARFPGSDVLLGTQMKSTGEVMGLSVSMAEAFGKSQLAAGTLLPRHGRVFVSVQDDDKPAVVDLSKRLRALGFTLLTTEGTHAYLANKRVASDCVAKVQQGGRHIGEQVRAGEVALMINTVDASVQTTQDGFVLRREAVTRGVPYFTTVEAARLAVAALEAQAEGERQYRPLQDWLSNRLG